MIRNKLRRRTILNIGMTSLLTAVLVPRVLAATGWLNSDLIDGIQGLFYGISIGFNLLWVSMTSKRRKGKE